MQLIAEEGIVADNYKVRSTLDGAMHTVAMEYKVAGQDENRALVGTIHTDSSGYSFVVAATTKDGAHNGTQHAVIDLSEVTVSGNIDPGKVVRWIAKKLKNILGNQGY